MTPKQIARIAAVVLAAGRSTRMARNKLLIDMGGKPLVAHAVDAALEAGLAPVLVVTGHQAEAVQAALAGRPVTFVHNARFEDGMASSLQAGIAALSDDIDAALVCLGDMPSVGPRHMAAIAAAYAPESQRSICVPFSQGQRGNPVLLGRRFFPEIAQLSGDSGARPLLAAHADQVWPVELADDAVLTDLDTPEALAEFIGQQGPQAS